jgi:hypothetical protein
MRHPGFGSMPRNLWSSTILGLALACFSACFASDRSADNSPVSDLYEHPQVIEIEGYHDDAMEPCISLDGRYLFFNNSNADKAETHIHFAKRLAGNRFRYGGLLPGTRSNSKDMAPSIDRSNRMYFTSLRSFAVNQKSIYAGTWHPNEVSNVSAVSGNVSPKDPFIINMDSCISPDGNILIVSRAEFLFSKDPGKSDLLMASRTPDGSFQLNRLLQNTINSLNTSALEYAPAITEDLRELYFTRCHKTGKGPLFETMVARRLRLNQPFSPPERLSAIDGFAEAPSLTLDKHELFYHKRIDNVFRICMVTRKPGR